jgi:pimeloyl-ACP methyl ester carboxylesterase
LIAIALPTHGTTVNAILYTASGAGPHRTVLLLHGLPGFEVNLDLARALQRDGWNVLTFNYRGNWGSPGIYSFTHCIEDTQAALAWLHAPTGEAAAHIDPDRIVVIGHSLGGFNAAAAASGDPRVLGTVLISAAPIGSIAFLPHDTAAKTIEENVLNDQGLHAIGDTTAAELADEVARNGAAWAWTRFAPGLSRRPLFVITSDDGFGAPDEALAKAAEAQPGAATVTRLHLTTDHGYDDQRIALERAVIGWVDALGSNP